MFVSYVCHTMQSGNEVGNSTMWGMVRRSDGSLKRAPKAVADRVKANESLLMVLLRNTLVGSLSPWAFAQRAWLEREETKLKMDRSMFLGSPSTFLKKALEVAPRITIYEIFEMLLVLTQQLQNTTSTHGTRLSAGLRAWLQSEEGMLAPMHPVVRAMLLESPRIEIDKFAYFLSVEHHSLTNALKLIQKEIDARSLTDYAIWTWVKDGMELAVRNEIDWTAALLSTEVLAHRRDVARIHKPLWGESEAIDKSAIREDQILAQQAKPQTTMLKLDKATARWAFGARDVGGSGGAPNTGGGKFKKGGDGGKGGGAPNKQPIKPKKPGQAKRQTAPALRKELKVLIDAYGTAEQLKASRKICVFFAMGSPCSDYDASVDKDNCTFINPRGEAVRTNEHKCLCKGSHPLALCDKWKKK